MDPPGVQRSATRVTGRARPVRARTDRARPSFVPARRTCTRGPARGPARCRLFRPSREPPRRPAASSTMSGQRLQANDDDAEIDASIPGKPRRLGGSRKRLVVPPLCLEDPRQKKQSGLVTRLHAQRASAHLLGRGIVPLVVQQHAVIDERVKRLRIHPQALLGEDAASRQIASRLPEAAHTRRAHA